jgi:hypothetical protein
LNRAAWRRVAMSGCVRPKADCLALNELRQ